MTRPAIIFGSIGMLGSDLVAAWERVRAEEADALPPAVGVADWNVVEITDERAVGEFITRHEPRLVVNCAAYTDVDGCTRDPELAMNVNGRAPGYIAAACAKVGARMVHISTDFVFDGKSDRPYVEDDPVGPISAYGESKLAGERAAQQHLPGACIVRTAWLYGASGKNFVATMLRLGRERDELRVVSDQVGCPTYTVDLAEAILRLILAGAEGVVHVVNSGQCSWCDLARKALELAGISTPVLSITAAEFKSPTERPGYSVLSTARYTALTGRRMRSWTEALPEFIERYMSR
ncbi:MAG: dTDP-4-dehydrorhamnose reductase [Phycisphaerae bacterium]|nr:dTDP-4-dehydrorhamnose reductase [Phycisphaerae bacterium]